MSLVRLALRLVAMKALAGKTIAQDRVRDSEITALDDAVNSESQPVIMIYTDDQRLKLTGKSLYDSSGTVGLVFVLAIAQPVATTIEGKTEVSITFPPSDAATEMQVDIMERQLVMALSDPDDPWAALYRKLVVGYDKCESMRGASEKSGARFAARYIQFDVQTLNDPTPGKAVEDLPFWNELVAAINADQDSDLANLGPVLKALIEGKTSTAWQVAMRDLGLPDKQSAEDLGVLEAPLDGVTDEDGNARGLAVITVDDADRDTSRDITP